MVDPVNQDNKYRALVEKLIKSEPNGRPKFQDYQKKLEQTRQKSVRNKENSNVIVQGKTHLDSNIQTQTIPARK